MFLLNLTPDQWTVIADVLAIILFMFSGIKFSYNGFIRWRGEDSGRRIGKFEFFLGIVLFIFSIACVILLIYLVKNGALTASSDPSILVNDNGPEDKLDKSDIYLELTYHGADYSGYVNESREPNGRGTMVYANGCEYTGDWVDGVRQGHGIMKYENGVYDGEWRNDQKNGQGTYTWNDGKKYEGAYEDDVRSGEGIFSGWVDLTNGYTGTYWGESKNNQFEGSGRFLFDNGDTFEGVYQEDLFWTGVYTKKDGTSYEIVNGQPQ